MPTAETWSFFDPASKDLVLRVLRREIDDTLAMVADPTRWDAPTACEEWQVRDIVGHLVDTTEGYLPSFDIARNGGTAPEPVGLRVMANMVDEAAKALRKVPQDELLGRLRDDAATMLAIFDGLSADDWTNLMVPHLFMGPLPAMFYPMFQLVDYAVHAWDVREGSGQPHAMAADAADLLVPVIFILWQATADCSGVKAPSSFGVRVSGHNGGDTRMEISPDGVTFAPGDISDCAGILEFDPATFVLTGYARMNGGSVHGDAKAASAFRGLFFPI